MGLDKVMDDKILQALTDNTLKGNKMYTLKLTWGQLDVIRQSIWADIDSNEYEIPDYTNVSMLTQYLDRAKVIDIINTELEAKKS